MNIKDSCNGDVCVISPEGRLDALNANRFRHHFQDLAKESRDFVVDLEEIEFIDSTGLGALVACLKTAAESGGNVKIANLQQKTRMVFEITRAYKIFDIFDDVDTAVSSYV